MMFLEMRAPHFFAEIEDTIDLACGNRKRPEATAKGQRLLLEIIRHEGWNQNSEPCEYESFSVSGKGGASSACAIINLGAM